MRNHMLGLAVSIADCHFFGRTVTLEGDCVCVTHYEIALLYTAQITGRAS